MTLVNRVENLPKYGMFCIEHSSGGLALYVEVGCAVIGHVPQPELLDSLKTRLCELENLRLLSPDDLQIVSERRRLRQQINELERQELAPPQVPAA